MSGSTNAHEPDMLVSPGCSPNRVKKQLALQSAGSLLLLVSLALLPVIGISGYSLTVFNLAGINLVAVLGFYLILGLAGQFNLATASFCGVGAYATALLTVKVGWPIPFSWLAALTLCAVSGLLLGLASFKLRGRYLTIATLGFGNIFVMVLTNWERLTNGADGIFGIPAPAPFGLSLSSREHYYYLVLFCTVISILLAKHIRHSRLGLALQAIREDELAAMACGIDTFLYKVVAFMLSAVYCGLAGILYAHLMRYISPGDFAVDKSFAYLIMLVLGGRDSIAGAAIGAIVVTILPEWLRILQNYHRVVFGLSVLLIMSFMPSGLVGAVHTFWQWLILRWGFPSGSCRS